MKSKLFTCLTMLFLSLSLVAQPKKVSGTVVDKIGPVIGASVVEKGTSNGVITDLDGNYTLNVPQGAVLVFSSIGYQSSLLAIARFKGQQPSACAEIRRGSLSIKPMAYRSFKPFQSPAIVQPSPTEIAI